jgi:hypothetical protein
VLAPPAPAVVAPPVAVDPPEAASVWAPPPQAEPPRKWPPPQPALRAIAPLAPVVPAAPEPVASLASLPRASIVNPKPSREQLVIDELELWLDAIHVTRADRQP